MRFVSSSARSIGWSDLSLIRLEPIFAARSATYILRMLNLEATPNIDAFAIENAWSRRRDLCFKFE